MAHSRRSSSEINAGSMADIAFLLLIFFLVVSTMQNDVGINRKLPKECKTADCSADIHERNLFSIKLNDTNELMVNNEVLSISQLKEKVKAFVDNNGLNACSYCNGKQITTASDHPTKAVISILSARNASYENYVAVQDELVAAYYDLRLAYIKKQYGKPISKLTTEELKDVKDAYPFLISEAELH